MSAAFHLGRIDNLVPPALMTSYPAWALLGVLEPTRIAIALAFGLTFTLGSRRVFAGALARYTSASS